MAAGPSEWLRTPLRFAGRPPHSLPLFTRSRAPVLARDAPAPSPHTHPPPPQSPYSSHPTPARSPPRTDTHPRTRPDASPTPPPKPPPTPPIPAPAAAPGQVQPPQRPPAADTRVASSAASATLTPDSGPCTHSPTPNTHHAHTGRSHPTFALSHYTDTPRTPLRPPSTRSTAQAGGLRSVHSGTTATPGPEANPIVRAHS